MAAETSSGYSSLSSSLDVFFRPPSIEDLDALYAIESASYPPDEAATREKLDYRIRNASNVFMVAVRPAADSSSSDEILGFTCGTCSTNSTLTHESMSTHEAEGSLLCIHSVVIKQELRRQGLAVRMLKAYIQYVQASTPQLASIHLLCKQQLVGLYEKAGFSLLGPSPVVHGQDQWFEMAVDLVH